jgi:hypothetical protein
MDASWPVGLGMVDPVAARGAKQRPQFHPMKAVLVENSLISSEGAFPLTNSLTPRLFGVFSFFADYQCKEELHLFGIKKCLHGNV